MEQNTEYRKDIMAGKTILYVHGFASSGSSGTVKGLRTLMPSATVIAPDLPVHPSEAMELLQSICKDKKPNLIIGTSMGGMYAEMLNGVDRILVNPAFRIAETMVSHNMMGRIEFHNPRQDGMKDFLVNKQLLSEFRDVSSRCFENADKEAANVAVYGLFGIHDTLVDTFDVFSRHYYNAIRFNGDHYLNDHVLVHSVMPVVQWIDDRQEKREKPILYISLEDTLADCRNGWRKLSDENQKLFEGHWQDAPHFHQTVEPTATAVKAFHTLSQSYDTYILTSAPYNAPEAWADKLQWVEKWLGVPAYDRLIISNHKNLSYGDYLIDCSNCYGADSFMGTHITFGTDPYKTWEDIMEFFSRLGGQ